MTKPRGETTHREPTEILHLKLARTISSSDWSFLFLYPSSWIVLVPPGIVGQWRNVETVLSPIQDRFRAISGKGQSA